MKEELMFDGITEIREDIIERAEGYVFQGELTSDEVVNGTVKKKRRVIPIWLTVTVIAACLLLVIGTPFVYLATKKCGSAAPPESAAPGSIKNEDVRPGDMAPELSVATEEIWIYYVEAGEICREQQLVKLQPADIFELWKEKNGIGAEVQLLDCELRSNATTEEMGEVVVHTVGDYFALYLTVSKNLEAYYEQTEEGLLLDSLEQTMTGYSGLTYQEYYLILE